MTHVPLMQNVQNVCHHRKHLELEHPRNFFLLKKSYEYIGKDTTGYADRDIIMSKPFLT